MHSTSAKAVLPKLDRIFAAYGVPQVVKCDNGPAFHGQEFAQFADYLGFKHRKVTPLWPEANGEVERFMKKFGKVSVQLLSERNRCTTSCETIEQLLIVLRMSHLPLACPVAVPCETNLKPALMREHDAHQKLKMKTLAGSRRPIKDSDIQVGDIVLVKQPKTGSSPHHNT